MDKSDKLADEIKEFLELDYSAKIIPVKNKKQINGWSCGSTSLKMVLSFYGVHHSVVTLSDECGTTKEDGTPFSGMVSVARGNGMKVITLRNSSIAVLKKYIDDGKPVIVVYQSSPQIGDTHYSVLIGYDRNSLIFCDPARWYAYYVKINTRRFSKIWKDLEDGSRGNGMVISPK